MVGSVANPPFGGVAPFRGSALSSNVQADYYNYQISVNVTDGYETTFSYSSEVMSPEVRYEGLNLTSLECKHVEVAISLPGNCEEKTASGALLIS